MQELKRTLSYLASFSVAFTYISPAVGGLTLFGFGLKTAGPAYIWGVPIIVVGQMFAACIFAELAVAMPVSGALYHWSKRLVGPRYAWLLGWLYLVSMITNIAAVDIGGASFLAPLLGLQPSSNGYINACIAFGILVIHTIVNVMGLSSASFLTVAGVLVEAGSSLLVAFICLCLGQLRPVSDLFSTSVLISNTTVSKTASFSNYLTALMAISWIFFGFEGCVEHAEETINPQAKVPKVIIMALASSGFVGLLLLTSLVLAIPDLQYAQSLPDNQVVSYVIESRIGPLASKFLYFILASAYISCGIAAQSSASRVLYSYARDGTIPGSHLLSRVARKQKDSDPVPIISILVTALIVGLLIGCSLLDLGSNNLNLEMLVAGYAVIGVYTAYSMVVAARLYRQFKHDKGSSIHSNFLASLRSFSGKKSENGYFSLGPAWTAVIVCVMSIIYSWLMLVVLLWPRPYDHISGYISLLTFGAVAAIGFLLLSWSNERINASSEEKAALLSINAGDEPVNVSSPILPSSIEHHHSASQ